MTLTIDKQTIKQYKVLDYYRDISLRINLRAACDTQLYPQSTEKIDTQVTIKEDVKYSLNVRAVGNPGLEINTRNNTLGVTVIFPTFQGVISLDVKNISPEIVVISKGTIIGTLMLIPFQV